MIRKAIPYFFIILFMVTACNRDNQRTEAQKIVKEWTGKILKIPEGIDSYFMNKDTLVPPSKADYKIFVYTDSTGCTSCTLNLGAWKRFVNESDSLLGDKLDFLFYFQPKNEKELQYLIKRDNFEHVVFMDKSAKLQGLNSFPSEMKYQTFLLDRNNKVISIGNPTLKPKIWELYKQIILNDGKDDS